MDKFKTTLQVSRSKENPDIFIFTISTPTLRTQFKLPKKTVNQLRVDLERLIVGK
ncbi:MAG: hypothetical protein K9L84_04130 [Candidatus Omnitrophica bacterium]|nr:hypothetical protein [Candidatus Omnitrophota bacterium]MCF7894229.1 hypothetical protein [Candidatus Omnitrophota bacterium]